MKITSAHQKSMRPRTLPSESKMKTIVDSTTKFGTESIGGAFSLSENLSNSFCASVRIKLCRIVPSTTADVI
ncbi:hypothetical protein Ae201684_009887 [Aphanomyces euteiches]|uniref:Uncharacterized protein n=1 Tax=Aphanomyces euteiches TaxID=100861 RepID=A0A6G0WZN7_9STRA|nr:hypothetical protein Ae201684_009887 [Aphanomyces euteiches]